jgi:hypothetical protein
MKFKCTKCRRRFFSDDEMMEHFHEQCRKRAM